MNSFTSYARSYHAKGFPVVPLPKGKKGPRIPNWNQFCKTLPTQELMEQWLRDPSSHGIGLCCGEQSGVIGLDVDLDINDPVKRSIYEAIEPFLQGSPIEKVGKKGFTRLFRYNGEKSRSLKVKIQGNDYGVLDILSDGRQTVLPGSLHPDTGQPYRWTGTKELLDLDDEELPALDSNNISSIETILKQMSDATSAGRTGPGSRTNTLKGLACSQIIRGVANENIVANLLEFDSKNHSPALFSDESESQMRNRSPEENATRFVQSIRASLERNGIASASDDRAIEWSEPQPLPSLDVHVPGLDIKLVPAPLRKFVLDISERLQVPPDYPATSLMAAVGSVIGRQCAIRPKQFDDWMVLPNLWAVLIGRPSLLKTPALQEALRPLYKLIDSEHSTFAEQKVDAELEADALDSKIQDLKKGIKELQLEGGDFSELRAELITVQQSRDSLRIKSKRFVTNDATVEKLTELIEANPNGLAIIRDEICGFLKTMDKPGRDGDREFFLESWGGTGSYQTDRIGRGSKFVKGIRLAILGTTQPGKLNEYIQDAIRGGTGDDGLIQRFQLAVFPQPSKQWENVDRKPDLKAREAVNKIFRSLVSLEDEIFAVTDKDDSSEIPFVRFNAEAQELFNDWLKKLEHRLRSGEILSPTLEAHLGKFRSLVPSLALIDFLVELVDGRTLEEAVPRHSVKRAIGWAEFLEAHASKIYSAAVQPEIHAAHALAEKIKRGKVKDGSSVRDIYRHHWSLLDTSLKVDAALAVLEEGHWVRVIEVPTGGAPKEIVRINPALLGAL